MVNAGTSAIAEEEADEQINEALKSYKIADVAAKDIRRALVERSGMLQESSEQKIEFLHNTIKEFLAAERFVNIGTAATIKLLTDRSEDSSWQPVILFALALPRDGSSFGTDLLRSLIHETPLDNPVKGRSYADKAKAARLRAKQFFLLRCFSNTYQINNPDINPTFDRLSKQIFPPRNMSDAEALATCGESIVPYLKYNSRSRAAERAACVRTLGLIGGSQAKTMLGDYLDDRNLSVAAELANHFDDWNQILAVRTYVEKHHRLPGQPWKKCQNRSQIANLTNLTNLTEMYLWGTKVSDISFLAHLSNLKIYI
jgi:hypothetical protein